MGCVAHMSCTFHALVQYRDSVADIVNVLSVHSPTIRVACFVGQSTGKEKRGLKQKEVGHGHDHARCCSDVLPRIDAPEKVLHDVTLAT